MNCIKRYVLCAIVLLAALGAAAVSHAQSPFDGTWRINAAQSKLAPKPFTSYTSQGWFHCMSCTPAYDVQADGQDHPVQGQAYDSVSVTLVDAHTVKFVNKKDGKTISEITSVVSADGKTLTNTFTSYPMNGGEPVHEVGTFKRVGILSSGVHATSGNWEIVKFTGSENDLLFSCKTNGDELTMTDPTGDSYTAKFDGNDYPYKGSYGTDAVSLKRIGDRTIEETDKLKGKAQDTQTMTVSPDGKTMTIVVHDLLRDGTSTFVATKK
jgi:hypothetical protein